MSFKWEEIYGIVINIELSEWIFEENWYFKLRKDQHSVIISYFQIEFTQFLLKLWITKKSLRTFLEMIFHFSYKKHCRKRITKQIFLKYKNNPNRFFSIKWKSIEIFNENVNAKSKSKKQNIKNNEENVSGIWLSDNNCAPQKLYGFHFILIIIKKNCRRIIVCFIQWSKSSLFS